MNEQIKNLKKYLTIYYISITILQILFFLCIGCSFVLYLDKDLGNLGEDTAVTIFTIVIILLFFIVSIAVDAAGIYFANKVTKFAYYFHLIVAMFGLISFITIAPSIYFLIQLTKPEVKQSYGIN